jgi:hypothetical protein
VSALKVRIAGVDAAKELAARQVGIRGGRPRARRPEDRAPGSRRRLGELQVLIKNATVTRTRADTVWQNARMALSEAEAGMRLNYKPPDRPAQRARDAPCWPCAATGVTCRKPGAVLRAARRWWPRTRMRTRSSCASASCNQPGAR